MKMHDTLYDGSAQSFINSLLRDAIKKRASDIHLESARENLRIRYRIDGVLYDIQREFCANVSHILSRIRVLSAINIAKKRAPQDGKFSFVYLNRSIDIRVSTFPAQFGEKCVLRILDPALHAINLSQLGMHADVYSLFKVLIEKNSGFFLVTGPTGSGKTTTLYAALSYLNTIERNIITLEDPVEYELTGITQGNIHPEAGFTFEKGIRAILRQDPDIAMIGEIRDAVSACVAIEAALAGHLIVSTLHTRNAPGAITRLIDMGIEPFLVNAAINGVLAQRLARRICSSCNETRQPTDSEKKVLEKWHLSLPTISYGKGCHICEHLGYKGRIGIFELCVISNTLRSLIIQKPSIDILYDQACKDGMKTLYDDAAQKLKSGTISLEEFTRVLS